VSQVGGINITVIDPEDQTSPKVLRQIVSATGMKVGGDLIADGTSAQQQFFEVLLEENLEGRLLPFEAGFGRRVG